MEINRKPIMDRQIAIASSIINAQYNLDVTEKNIVYLALAGINQFNKIEEGSWHRVNLEDFANLCERRLDNAKIDIIKAVKSLYHRSIKLNKEVKEEHRWITGYRELDVENNIYIKWNPDLLPHLAELKTYAKLLTRELKGVKGKYTNRILELVSQCKSNGRRKGEIYITLEDFLYIIKAPETYKDFKYLKRDILVPSIKELIMLVRIVMTPKRLERKVVGFSLYYEFHRDD